MKQVLAISFLLITLGGCQKNTDVFLEDIVELPDRQWVAESDTTGEINNLYAEIQPELVSGDVVLQGDQGGSVMLGDSVIMEYGDRTFEDSGRIINGGTIRFEIWILKRKGEWIRANITTLGNSQVILESHGIIRARAWQNGRQIRLRAGAALTFRYLYPNPKPAMSFHIGQLPQGAGVFFQHSWAPNSQLGKVTAFGPGMQVGDSLPRGGYIVQSRALGWMGVAMPADVSPRNAIVTVGLPEGFQNRNTHVYIALQKKQTVLGLRPDTANKIWFARQIPLAEPFTVISLTRQNGKIYLGAARTESAGISKETFFNIRPREVSIAELMRFLNGL